MRTMTPRLSTAPLCALTRAVIVALLLALVGLPGLGAPATRARADLCTACADHPMSLTIALPGRPGRIR